MYLYKCICLFVVVDVVVVVVIINNIQSKLNTQSDPDSHTPPPPRRGPQPMGSVSNVAINFSVRAEQQLHGSEGFNGNRRGRGEGGGRGRGRGEGGEQLMMISYCTHTVLFCCVSRCMCTTGVSILVGTFVFGIIFLFCVERWTGIRIRIRIRVRLACHFHLTWPCCHRYVE